MFAVLSPMREAPALDVAPGLDDDNPALSGDRVGLQYPKLSAWSGRDLVRYQCDTAFVASSTPLLLVNRQLHDETLSNFNVFPDLCSYDLNIIVLDEILLLPTWLRVPALTTRVDTVCATIRISSSFDRNKKWYPRDPYKASVSAMEQGRQWLGRYTACSIDSSWSACPRSGPRKARSRTSKSGRFRSTSRPRMGSIQAGLAHRSVQARVVQYKKTTSLIQTILPNSLSAKSNTC
ncbi:hypothetical protein BCR34DRAFT_577868 [Clohesyomyces aquaticus]|uniref:Uncharacterized protein n=1 Tax=Clohesyomyces aquaticus TaxID=1231657 RepID=A0A1Y1YIF4_9PLEO|nr:hypothetical protein BCR34DRAFT_577868 [Clohesyomyces aquaticus]